MFMKYLYNSLKMAAFFSSQPLVGRKKRNDDEVCKLLIINLLEARKFTYG